MEDQKEQALAIHQAQNHSISIFSDMQSFENGQRIAKLLSSSNLVPDAYKNNIPNTMIALNQAHRLGADPFMVMQNMHVIQGRPSWASQFVIGLLNTCGRFTPLRFKIEKLGKKEVPYEYWTGDKGNRKKETGKITIEDMSCIAYAKEKATGELIEGPPVTITMAVAEGWYTKSDSKWKTMPEHMIRYRAAAFFGRLYAPDVLMGLQTDEEIIDVVESRNSSVHNAPKPCTGKGVGALNDEITQPADAPGDEEIIQDAEFVSVSEPPAQDSELL